jgi:4-carboxymuconolactone decarboxylase
MRAFAARGARLQREDHMAKDVFDKGLAIRREVLGKDYVDNAIKSADDFNRPLQEFVTEYCWGAVWGRPGLSKKTRSMLNLAMLTALNKPHELKLHVRGALNNGVTREEISEIFLHAAVYAGVPAAVDAFRTAREVLKEAGGD